MRNRYVGKYKWCYFVADFELQKIFHHYCIKYA